MTFDELGHLTGGFSSWIERDHRLFPQNGQLPKRWGTLPLLASDVRLPAASQDVWWNSDLDRFGHQFLYENGNDLERILHLCRSAMIVIGLVLGAVVFLFVEIPLRPGRGLRVARVMRSLLRCSAYGGS